MLRAMKVASGPREATSIACKSVTRHASHVKHRMENVTRHTSRVTCIFVFFLSWLEFPLSMAISLNAVHRMLEFRVLRFAFGV